MTGGAAAFDLPAAREAHEPPEARGLARDAVRLMVAERGSGRIEHARFRDLPAYLAPGDLVVVNVSATIAAAVGATRSDGTRVHVHVATRAPHAPSDDWWVVEVRCEGGAAPFRAARAGDRLTLDGGATAELAAPYAGGTRLWLAEIHAPAPLPRWLEAHGQPIRYGYVPRRWPLARYQTVYALEPGSAEMPRAGRPFTAELITRLVAGGVGIAPVTLHTGVSSPEGHEPPYPEQFAVPARTARLVDDAHAAGGRVIAVGTTVVRALESAAARDGGVAAAEGWTRLVIGPERGVRAVDGIITGWHEPAASHLQMLEQIAGPELLARSYTAALEHGYLWHEFGDSHLILP
ncbi:MAG: S-adenosylmethionine:tRNA ribosyltransferase-isomerase [Solirubrobacteraceae bacterium]